MFKRYQNHGLFEPRGIQTKFEVSNTFVIMHERDIIDTIDAKMGSPLSWKTICSDQGCHLKFGDVDKLFNYLHMEAFVKYKVAIAAYVRCGSSF